MAIVWIGFAVASAVVCWGTSLQWPAVVAAVLCVWSTGVMRNFRRDPQNVPAFAVFVSMVSTVTAIALGAVAIFVY